MNSITGVLSRRPVRRLAAVAGIAVALGALTAWGQGRLAAPVASLTNSAGSWVLIAFLLALTATGVRPALLFGFVALALLLAGYVIGAATRGSTASTSLLVFWTAAAIVVGPLIGLAAWQIRSGRESAAAIGAGGIAGLLVGEGVYGLTYLSDTTDARYWWAQMVVGGGIVVWASVRGRRHALSAVGAAGAAVVVAAVFLGLYPLNLIGLL